MGLAGDGPRQRFVAKVGFLPQSAAEVRGKTAQREAVCARSSWQKSEPNSEAQYLKKIRTRADLFVVRNTTKRGAPMVHPFLSRLSGCASLQGKFAALTRRQPEGRLLSAACTCMAECQIGQISNFRHAAGCGRHGRPGALRLGACPCGQALIGIRRDGAPPPIRKSHSRRNGKETCRETGRVKGKGSCELCSSAFASRRFR